MTAGDESSSDPRVRAMVIAAMFASGCSAIAVRGPRTASTGEVVCTTPSYVPPVIDAVIALAGVALIVWGATAEHDPEGHVVDGRNFAAYPGVAITVPFGISSGYGFATASSCRRATRGR